MTDKVTFHAAPDGVKDSVRVYLGKQRIGTIFKRPEGYRYRVMGRSDIMGEPFPTLEACKRSVDGRDD